MNIYENNKQLLTAMGGDSYNLATDYEVRKAILDLLGGNSSNCNSIYEVDKQILNIYLEGGGGTGGDCDLTPITITENGVYSREIGGYSEVTVNVEIPECPEIPLTAITINSNGTYIPEEGGYNKVVVDVDSGGTGGGEKVKVKKIEVSNGCIVDGYWAAENIDTSNVTNMNSMFYGCSSLQSLDVSGFDTINVTRINSMFYGCSSLQTLDVSGFDTNNVTNMGSMFYGCKTLTQLDLTNWDASKVTSISTFCDFGTFNFNSLNVVGGLTYDEVVSNNICILNGLSVSANRIFGYEADRASYRALINGLADLTGYTTQNLSFYSLSILTDEDIAIATAKNWTISE